jgi:hypothetical protein
MSEFVVPPKRWFTHYRKLHLVWKWNYERYLNSHFNQQEWECLEEWTVFIGLDPDDRAFNYEDLYYDGHTVKYVTFLGICIGKCYGYEARPYERPATP